MLIGIHDYLYLVKRILLSTLFLGIGGLLGWVISYLRLPYVDGTRSLWIGLLIGIAICTQIAFVVALRKRARLERDASSDKPKNRSWLFASLLIILASLITSFILANRAGKYQRTIHKQANTIELLKAQLEAQDSLQNNGLLSRELILIDSELDSLNGFLSEKTIKRLASLSASFKPKKMLENDTLSSIERSAERGRLLLALARSSLAPKTYQAIKDHVIFDYADLRDKDLRDLDLRGFRLRHADFTGANLQSGNLTKSDLYSALFQASNLEACRLDSCDLRRANFGWANLNRANLEHSNLNGANCSNASIVKAYLCNASIKWADLTDAIFHGSDLSDGTLYQSTMLRTNFDSANLNFVDVRLANMSESKLETTDITGLQVMPYWKDKFKEWEVQGGDQIISSYGTYLDSTASDGKIKLRMIKLN